MIRMFPAGVSEMCSLAVACRVTEFQKASSNGVDTLAASMSTVRYAAQSGVGIDFCASRYATGPELQSVSEVRARTAARVRAFIAAAHDRGNSPSGAPAIAKNVGDRSGEGKVILNEYEKASHNDDVFYLFLQKQKIGASSIYTFRKVRTIRGCLEGLALMV